MKKALLIFFAVLLFITFSSCREGNGGNTDSGTVSQRDKYMTRRMEFLNSDIYGKAYAYAVDALNGISTECQYAISLEPGKFIDEDPYVYEGFEDDAELCREFFNKADLHINTDLTVIGMDADTFCQMLIEKNISCEFMDDAMPDKVYHVDAVSGDIKIEMIPGV